MTDIMNICLGQSGIRIGKQLWNFFQQSHQLQSLPQGRKQVIFKSFQKGFNSRSIFIDVDQRQTNKIITNKHNTINQTNIIDTYYPTKGLYAVGRYHASMQIKQQYQNKIRKQNQLSDGISSYIVISSLGGGTGSGVGCSLSQSLRQSYCDKMVQSFKLIPSLYTAHPVQIYNSIFSLSFQTQQSDNTILFDNDALRKITKKQGYMHFDFHQMNREMAHRIQQLTTPYRFAGLLNTNPRKISTNIIMFPRMHFLGLSCGLKKDSNHLISALNPEHFLIDKLYIDYPQKRYLAHYIGTRDNFQTQESIRTIFNSQMEKRNYQTTQWIPNKLHLSLHDSTQSGKGTSVLVNSHHPHELFKKICQKFAQSYRRKAFIHLYLSEGMDEMQFIQAQSNINDLTSQYQPYDPYIGDQDQEVIYQ